jgi:small multidrug resistance pump
MFKGYALLTLAIMLEIVSTSMLKASCGFTKAMPGLAFIIGMGGCFYAFSKALMLLPLGIAYAIWAGVGTAFTAVIAVVFWHEQMNLSMVGGIICIMVGVILLNLKNITH